MNQDDLPRRDFVKQAALTGAAACAMSALSAELSAAVEPAANSAVPAVEPNMLGGYGPWAAGIVGDQPARLSFLQERFDNVDAWRKQAHARVMECLAQPETQSLHDVRVDSTEVSDGLAIQRISWQLGYGPRTQAIVLKPEKAKGKLPAVIGLHDHGGNKYFGLDKITRSSATQHPVMVRHQDHYYGGRAWANELAKRGYVVLVHDTYAFASRRLKMDEVAEPARKKVTPVDDDSEASIEIYNRFAGEHEHLMAKSLLCAGTTWPGIFTAEDQRALDYLCGREDVDADRVGCAGLSGGGLRTVYLGGIDSRIRCACCVGMMSTWRDYLLHKCHTHTWMIYIPLLPRDLDYPEVLAMRAPLPTLVQNNDQDSLFTLPEMQRADKMMAKVFQKAGAAERYRCTFYPGPHKFDVPMQSEAFEWFDRWLK